MSIPHSILLPAILDALVNEDSHLADALVGLAEDAEIGQPEPLGEDDDEVMREARARVAGRMQRHLSGKGKPLTEGKNPKSAIIRAGEHLAKSGKAMPGYGQIFIKENGSGEAWYVGGDGDERGFDRLVKETLMKVDGIDDVTYESEGFPPDGEGWIQVYPKEKALTESAMAVSTSDFAGHQTLQVNGKVKRSHLEEDTDPDNDDHADLIESLEDDAPAAVQRADLATSFLSKVLSGEYDFSTRELTHVLDGLTPDEITRVKAQVGITGEEWKAAEAACGTSFPDVPSTLTEGIGTDRRGRTYCWGPRGRVSCGTSSGKKESRKDVPALTLYIEYHDQEITAEATRDGWQSRIPVVASWLDKHFPVKGSPREAYDRAVKHINATAEADEEEAEPITESEVKDKLGRRQCYDDSTGKHIPCFDVSQHTSHVKPMAPTDLVKGGGVLVSSLKPDTVKRLKAAGHAQAFAGMLHLTDAGKIAALAHSDHFKSMLESGSLRAPKTHKEISVYAQLWDALPDEGREAMEDALGLDSEKINGVDTFRRELKQQVIKASPVTRQAAEMLAAHKADEHNQKIATALQEARDQLATATSYSKQIPFLKQIRQYKEAQAHESRRSFLLTFHLPPDEKDDRPHGAYKRTTTQTKNWETAADFLHDIQHKDGPGKQAVHIESKAGRAHYNAHTITTSIHDDVGITLHEYGHHLESQSPWVKEQVKEFRDGRFHKHEDKPMREVMPNCGYDKEEVGNKDELEKLFRGDRNSAYYAGKVYHNGETEIVSMGLELLYRDPVHFAETDSEFFNLIVSVLQADRGGNR